MSFDQNLFDIARDRLPLPRLMTTIGDGAYTKKNSECPFCQAKGGKFGLFKDEKNRDRFKCHAPGCVANENTVGHNEVAYLSLRRNLSAKDASLEYLKLAVPDLLAAQEAERDKEARKIVPMNPAPAGDPASPPPKQYKPPSNERNVWNALWRRLILNPSDRTKLKNQRGYSDAQIDNLGYRSNNQSNRTHLESLRADYTMEILLNEGIYIQKGSTEPRPNPQFLGWGRTKKKDEKGDYLWEWIDPILIPYLDEEGFCFFLRPHKGGVSPKKEEDEDDIDAEDDDENEDGEKTQCSSHVYSPYLLADLAGLVDGLVVLTEGEFKAGALHQCRIPALATPGINFIRNAGFRKELVDLLRHFAVKDLVICFDNEVKDDLRYKDKYKADPWKRWDTPMWAEYCAIVLQRDYFAGVNGSVRIGVLPDQFREEGKADFDSILHSFVQREGLEGGTAAARKAFEQVVHDARPQRQSHELFPSESRRIIECKLQRKLYKPLVAKGGKREQKLASQFLAIGESDLADAFRSTVHCYYERNTPDKKDRGGLINQATKLSAELKEAKDKGVNGSELRKLRLQTSAAWERVKGIPEAKSDFVLDCEFKLHTSDGRTERLVKIRNRSDRGKANHSLVRLRGAQLARSASFREAMLDTGHGVWKGGEILLQDLTEDMDHHSYYRDIFEINYYGYHKESGLWFFGDCAFGPKGELIEADANNIFWSDGIGYQIDSTIDERGTTFEQKAPLLLAPQDAKPKAIASKDLFNSISTDFYQTIGGYDGWLALGMMFAYAASPELLKQGGHPGLWLFGKMSGGKTTIARWLMRVWGFPDLGGVGIDDRTTHVGMNRFLAQYSCLPVWFDEYRAANIDPQKEAVVRGAFDRNSGAKGMADHTNRTRSAKIHTTPLITGESSSSDAATRSRFSHVNVNDARRLGDGQSRYTSMQTECKHYYLLGRYLMENRTRFVEEMLGSLDNWMSFDEVRQQITNERVRFVYGTAYSAFITLAIMLESEAVAEEAEFRNFLLTHGEQALQDVITETFLSRFWDLVISALQRGRVKRRFFSVRYVSRDAEGRLTVINANDNGAIHVCFVAAQPVFDDYAEALRSKGEDPPLDLGDLRREMSKESYWMPAPKADNSRTHRIIIDGTKYNCWVISLEQLEGRYLFPFAEEVMGALSKVDESEL